MLQACNRDMPFRVLHRLLNFAVWALGLPDRLELLMRPALSGCARVSRGFWAIFYSTVEMPANTAWEAPGSLFNALRPMWQTECLCGSSLR